MKPQRQRLIAEIVRTTPIASQEQLVFELARYGVHTNQATISRDVKELGLAKVADRYAMPGEARAKTTWETVERTFQEHVSRIDHSDSLIVIKTPPGRAHMVAVVLDMLDSPEVVGTVAGDDTLLVVPRTRKVQDDLVHRFNSLWLGEEANA